jgi:hypothetical protein
MVPSRQFTVGLGGADPQRLAQFWAEVLGRQVQPFAPGPQGLPDGATVQNQEAVG